ncbi:hypothetical protein ABPG77_004897 [Micractinium sp. CCAP 211/92]
MSTEDKARGPKGIKPELEAGTFPITGEHLAEERSPNPAHVSEGEGSVGATSAQVDAAGFGSGPSRTGMTDVGRQKREQADPSLQRGQARQEKQ